MGANFLRRRCISSLQPLRSTKRHPWPCPRWTTTLASMAMTTKQLGRMMTSRSTSQVNFEYAIVSSSCVPHMFGCVTPAPASPCAYWRDNAGGPRVDQQGMFPAPPWWHAAHAAIAEPADSVRPFGGTPARPSADAAADQAAIEGPQVQGAGMAHAMKQESQVGGVHDVLHHVRRAWQGPRTLPPADLLTVHPLLYSGRVYACASTCSWEPPAPVCGFASNP